MINEQAVELNETIKRSNPAVLNLLSEKGKNIFFPKKGINAQAADAKGKEINATIGIALNDDKSPMRLSAVEECVRLPPQEVFPYAPSYGDSVLRTEWKNEILKKNPSLKASISNPVVTNALTHGLSVVGYLFLDENQELLMTDKFWGNYRLIFEHAYGAKIVGYNTFRSSGFDLDAFEEAFQGSGKKVLLINAPNNPSGYTPTENELERMSSIVKKYAESGNEVLVICDDAYFGLVYEEGPYTESPFNFFANLHENVLAVKVDGATKEYFAWGLRVGFLTYASKGMTKECFEALESKTAGVIRGNISSDSKLSQSIVLKALHSDSMASDKQKNFEVLKERVVEMKEVLKDEKYAEFFSALPFNSGYFVCLELNESLDAEEVRQVLLKDYSTGVISMGKSLLRIAFSCVPKNKIRTLLDNIYEACQKQRCLK
ncbi:aminotransferase class I/II-fold pyridoxal phosphate-dependent enzyme [Bacteroidota bacterium]